MPTLIDDADDEEVQRYVGSDRVGIVSLLAYGRGLALTVMVAAYVGQQAKDVTSQHQHHLASSFLPNLDHSVVYSTRMVLYALVVKFIVSYPLSLLLEKLRELRDSTNSAVIKVSSTETMSRLRTSVSRSSVRLLHLARGGGMSTDGWSMALSANDPFLPVEEIATMTLSDVTNMFRYASESRRADFDHSSFTSSLRGPAKRAIEAVDVALVSSLGDIVTSNGKGDEEEVDAFKFAAAVRLFAEWRTIRLVPEGSRSRYVFGMNLARRDLIQNVEKIEHSIHEWLDHHGSGHSPSLRDLLQFEASQNKHTRLPRLVDKSGASGILWTTRQLRYQAAIFENNAQVPILFKDSKSAVVAAYKAVYEKYHGFLVKQIFQSSFDVAPEPEQIFRYMMPPEDDETEALSDDESDDNWVQLPVDSEETPPSAAEYVQPDLIEDLGSFFSGEWGKLQRFFGQCVGAQVKTRPSRNVLHAADLNETLSKSSKPVSSALEYEIPYHVSVLQPLVSGIEDLIIKHNMNDPSRV